MTIQIQPIEPHQTGEAKRVILTVAWGIFQWPATLEESIELFEKRGELRDVDDPQSNYFDRKGTFLVAMDQGRIVGTGAIHNFNGDTAELKRLWLLEDYQGQGIGFQMWQRLLCFAQQAGYKHIRLLTDHRQERAIHFYKQIGFQLIPCRSDDQDDICMEIAI